MKTANADGASKEWPWRGNLSQTTELLTQKSNTTAREFRYATKLHIIAPTHFVRAQKVANMCLIRSFIFC